jgi:hypothetical protein
MWLPVSITAVIGMTNRSLSRQLQSTSAAMLRSWGGVGPPPSFLNLRPSRGPSEMGPMMRVHPDLTLSEAVNRLQGNFADDIADYDRSTCRSSTWPTC